MKRLLVLLSLLVLALFVVSCAPKESTDGEDGALAGEAYATKQCALTAKQCGFVQKSDIQLICEDVGVSTEDESLTGYQFCLKEGFDACSAIITKMSTAYLDSADKLCNGKLQDYKIDSFILPCESSLNLNPVTEIVDFGCMKNIDSKFVEPFYGDVKYNKQAQQVVCCKLK